MEEKEVKNNNIKEKSKWKHKLFPYLEIALIIMLALQISTSFIVNKKVDLEITIKTLDEQIVPTSCGCSVTAKDVLKSK